MKTPEKPTKLNQAQLHVLQLFERVKTKQELDDIKDLLAKYYAKKADEEMEKLLESEKVTVVNWNKGAQEHSRTPYK